MRVEIDREPTYHLIATRKELIALRIGIYRTPGNQLHLEPEESAQMLDEMDDILKAT